MNPANSAAVLFSGGLNSTVMLHLLMQEGAQVRPVTIVDGQTLRGEESAAQMFCERLSLKQETVDLTCIIPLIAETAPGNESVPEGHSTDTIEQKTVLANRMMIMLSVAVGNALARGGIYVAYGADAWKARFFSDCRPEFTGALDVAVMLGDPRRPRVVTPLLTYAKPQVVKIGDGLGVPMHLTWSCDLDGQLHCGKCTSCQMRKKAFELAEVRDLTEYEREVEILAPDGEPARSKPAIHLV